MGANGSKQQADGSTSSGAVDLYAILEVEETATADEIKVNPANHGTRTNLTSGGFTPDLLEILSPPGFEAPSGQES